MWWKDYKFEVDQLINVCTAGEKIGGRVKRVDPNLLVIEHEVYYKSCGGIAGYEHHFIPFNTITKIIVAYSSRPRAVRGVIYEGPVEQEINLPL